MRQPFQQPAATLVHGDRRRTPTFDLGTQHGATVLVAHQRHTAEEVAIRTALELHHPIERQHRAVLVALGTFSLEGVRAHDPQQVVCNRQALDVHLAVGPVRQAEDLAQPQVRVVAEARRAIAREPLDRRGLVTGDEHVVARRRQSGDVVVQQVGAVLYVLLLVKAQSDGLLGFGRRHAEDGRCACRYSRSSNCVSVQRPHGSVTVPRRAPAC